MTPLKQQLKKYRSINKGLVKPFQSTSGATLKLAASIPVLVIGSYASLSAQCSMNILSDVQIPFNGGLGGGLAFDVNGAGGPSNDFSIFEQTNTLGNRLKILNSDLQVLIPSGSASNFASALRVTGNTTAGNFVGIGNNTMWINYGINGSNGQFTSGTDGYVIFRSISTGAVGFFQLQYTYAGGFNHRVTIAQGGIGNVSGSITPGDCSSLVVLPVELIEFKAIERNESVNLNWKTASELNNAGFEIQRSLDGRNFQSISFVEGKGTISTLQEYAYQDDKVQENQLYYYRLKQIDFDGQFEYSDLIQIQLKGNKTIVSDVYPNPSKLGIVHIDVNSANQGNWNISVYDVVGKLVAKEQRSISAGISTEAFSFDQLDSGTYFIKIENNTERFYKKLTIAKE